jgi:hypothetical protein
MLMSSIFTPFDVTAQVVVATPTRLPLTKQEGRKKKDEQQHQERSHPLLPA